MDPLDAHEFKTLDPGYDPAKFYVTSLDDDKERTSVGMGKINIPLWRRAQMAKLVLGDEWPGYRTEHDVIRDGIAHIVERRLREAGDPEYNRVADSWGRWLEQTRMENDAKVDPDVVDRWERMLATQPDPEVRAFWVLCAREQAIYMGKFLRDRLNAICDRHV